MGYSVSWSNGPTTEDISNLTGSVYTAVIADTNGCVDSISVTINSFVSATSIDNATELIIYSNPTNGVVNISNLQPNETVLYFVFDALGRKVEEGQFTPTNTVIQFQNFESGTYYINIISDSRPAQTFHLMKQ